MLPQSFSLDLGSLQLDVFRVAGFFVTNYLYVKKVDMSSSEKPLQSLNDMTGSNELKWGSLG